MTTVSFSDHIEKITYIKESEDKDELTKSEYNEELDKKTEKKYISHTKFCSFGINKCRKGHKCIFAHTFKQLNPIICKWDKECLRKEKCYFKHSNETKVQYVLRAFPDDLKKLNIVLYENLDETSNTLKIKDDKNETNNETNEELNKDIPFDDDYKEKLASFIRMYYDPAFEFYSWADINEFVDSDNEYDNE